MSLMFYWKGDNYISDMGTGKAYHLNQNSELINNLQPGEHIWAFTKIKKTFVLAADLVVSKIQYNSPGYVYGQYRAVGDRQKTRYFDVNQKIDIEPLIRRIYPQAPTATRTGRSYSLGSFFEGFNGVRLLSHADEQLLTSFSKPLRVI